MGGNPNKAGEVRVSRAGSVRGSSGSCWCPQRARHSTRTPPTARRRRPPPPPPQRDRRLYDTYAQHVDIQSQAEKAAWAAATTADQIHSLGMPAGAPALLHRAMKQAPERYATAGNISAWGGGGFDPADARQELVAFNRPGLARVYTDIAVHDRSAPPAPWAERHSAIGPQ